MDWLTVLGFAVAAVGGAAVGLERQASGHADGASARFAGIRTFTMIGLLGGVAGGLVAGGAPLPAAVLLAGAAALVVVAYATASRVDVDGTTEVAALVVLAAGTIAGMGRLALAGSLFAFTALLLVEKTRLHALVRRIDDDDLRAALRFAAMALVILPALPAGPFGPGVGLRPRELWALVLFFSGLTFGAQLAQRAVGPRRGLTVAGALGGMVSSTNVTLTFARASRADPDAARSLAAGVLAANAVLFPRVLFATAVLNPPLALAVALRLAPALGVAMLAAWSGARGVPTGIAPPTGTATSLGLRPALQMAVLFQAVLYAVAAARTYLGAGGLILTAAILGLTDVDALTMTLARGSGDGTALDDAARAITVGILANTTLKLLIAALFGAAPFRRACLPGLGGIAAALALAMAW